MVLAGDLLTPWLARVKTVQKPMTFSRVVAQLRCDHNTSQVTSLTVHVKDPVQL